MTNTASRFDPQPPDRSSGGKTSGYGSSGPHTYSDKAGLPVDGEGYEIDLLALIGRAEQISREYQIRTLNRPLNRAYRAWQNQHSEKSKYLTNAFRGRSRLFVPKTRAAVMKNLATAAGALFSTEDVVNVSAAYDDDVRQRATAAVLKADLDYRLGAGSSAKVGVPWYLMCLGGALDAQLTGVTISKQYWQYDEVQVRRKEMRPLVDESSQEPLRHPDTGEVYSYEIEVEETLVTVDRPMIDVMPIENAFVDPAAPWYQPEQLGRWFFMRYPMGLSDARTMLNAPAKGGRDPGWIPVSDDLLLKGRIEDDRSGTRRTREGGTDRYEEGKGINDLDVVWLQENFLRISGVDYHWWSIGRFGYVSKVRTTREAYPELDGERPYVMGFAHIDTHRIYPMSPVESWQPLQLELNDITNLRQDTLKRSIAPIPIVKRGVNADLVALQRRGQPDAIILTNNPENDIKFQQTPGPSGAAYTETSVTNTMFDELAGVFSTSSVQSNRQLNETVGGMRIMSGSANAVSEFYLRTWVETWVERVLRQVIHLIRAYESDEKILAIAGAKARAAELGYLPSLSDFDETELLLRVNVGIGAMDPMQQLAKLKVALEMLSPAFSAMGAQGIKPKYDVLIEEIMGKAGYRDGRRFFEFGEPQQQQPDPDLLKTMEELKLKAREIDVGFRETQLELASRERIADKKNATDLQRTGDDRKAKLLEKLVDVEHGREQRANDALRERERADQGARQRIAEAIAGRIGEAGRAENEQESSSEDEGSEVSQAFHDIMQRLDAMSQRSSSVERSVAAIANHLVSQKQPRAQQS